MVIELTMPRLSDTMEQGTIIRWNVKEGDAVELMQIIGHHAEIGEAARKID